MKSISNKLASLLLMAGAWLGSAAHAVQDLPGGPAVNQLNLAPPVTKIAEEQHFLHWMTAANRYEKKLFCLIINCIFPLKRNIEPPI